MKTTRYSIFLAIPLTLLACASDPNKEANDAHNAELKSQRQDREAVAEAKGDQREKAADNQQKATTANAVGSEATKDRVEADAKLKEAREVARSKANERLEKADARTAELKAIVDRKGAKATTASRDALAAVDKQRLNTTQAIEKISVANNDGLDSAKSNADSQLDTLESYVKQAGKEVDKFK